MKDVYIIGSYSIQFKKWPELSYRDLVRDAYLGVLQDAKMENGDQIEFAWFGNCGMAALGQSSIRGQVCFIPLVREGLFPERVPIINVEGACATASMALHGAWKDILSGQTECSLAVGVEKLFSPTIDKAATLKSFAGGMDNFTPEETIQVYKDAGNVIGQEFAPADNRTLFMDTYAMQAKYHMWKYGTTQRQIAVGCSKNHNFGALNPKAQYQFEVSVDQALEDRLISYPLTRSMCAPIGDGAASAIVCSEDFLKNLPSGVQNRAVKIKASVLTGGKYRDFDEPGLSKVGADKAYEMAGVGPGDIDVAEIHDATSFCEIYQSEMMGFCPIGEGGPFVESGATMLDGKIPINTGGGLVSKGHPVGATGLSMIYELVTQLRDEAGPRQVKGARLALQENGGGVIGFEEAACSIIILEKDQ
ncbi:MAG: thiolase family protein [Deltaproteobacteria bacterium]|nr:thiolase family protein [Deltaproteobacteria bacterium]MBW2084989.1 thiolase family protein [Deltaproteobacteria bacterium]